MVSDPDPTSRDRETLRRLEAAGADLSRPLDVEFFVHLPGPTQARSLADELRAEGYDTEVVEAAGPDDPWAVVARSRFVATERELASVRSGLSGRAARHGGHVDGWGAEVNTPG
jgi:hypothetical protein